MILNQFQTVVIDLVLEIFARILWFYLIFFDS